MKVDPQFVELYERGFQDTFALCRDRGLALNPTQDFAWALEWWGDCESVMTARGIARRIAQGTPRRSELGRVPHVLGQEWQGGVSIHRAVCRCNSGRSEASRSRTSYLK